MTMGLLPKPRGRRVGRAGTLRILMIPRGHGRQRGPASCVASDPGRHVPRSEGATPCP